MIQKQSPQADFARRRTAALLPFFVRRVHPLNKIKPGDELKKWKQ